MFDKCFYRGKRRRELSSDEEEEEDETSSVFSGSSGTSSLPERPISPVVRIISRQCQFIAFQMD